jgi:hypothetical protein
LTDLPSREGLIYQPSPLRGEGEGEGVLIVYEQTLNRVPGFDGSRIQVKHLTP